MASTFRLDTGIDAMTTPTCRLFADGSDTVLDSGTALTEATNANGVYTASVSRTGLHRIEYFENGVWQGYKWGYLVDGQAVDTYDDRRIALAGQTGGLSLHDTVSAVKTKTDFLPSATAGTTGGVATEPVEATLSAGDITSIASQISSNLTDVDVQLVDAVTAVSKLTLTQGTDYYDADGKAVAWTFTNRSYTPTSCKLTVCSGNVKTWTTTPVETSGSGSTSFHAEFDIDRATADELEAGDGTFEVISVLANGREIAEISEGVARIKRRLTP